MKKIILLTLGIILSSVCLMGQQNVYVIDNVTIEHFNGSQLKGKTIKDYQISTTGKGKKAITVHSITTSPQMFSRPFSVDTLGFSKDIKVYHDSPKKLVYVIDGIKYNDTSTLKTISPEDIQSITVLKDGSPEQLMYGVDCSVILITTKNGQKLPVR